MAPGRKVMTIQPEPERLGWRLKRLRSEAGETGELSQAQAGARVGLSQAGWSKLERSQVAMPGPKMLAKIEMAYDLPPGELGRIAWEHNGWEAQYRPLPYNVVAIGPADPAFEALLERGEGLGSLRRHRVGRNPPYPRGRRRPRRLLTQRLTIAEQNLSAWHRHAGTCHIPRAKVRPADRLIEHIGACRCASPSTVPVSRSRRFTFDGFDRAGKARPPCPGGDRYDVQNPFSQRRLLQQSSLTLHASNEQQITPSAVLVPVHCNPLQHSVSCP